MAMRDRLKLMMKFDPQRLREDLTRIEGSGWTEHFVRRNYEGAWSVIPLRAPAGEHHVIRMIYPNPSCTEFVDTPFLDGAHYVQEVLASLGSPLDAVRLMKLAPGSVIKEHTDHALSAEEGTIRLHIPVITNPDVDFRLNGERVTMNEGECWYLRLSDPHSVANRGVTDRVHLVIDARIDRWMEERLNQAEMEAISLNS
ncbi:MAG: L-proline cis-4-hydroxylase [Chlorobi bacterium]|nr:L-proline cis-4-hydroxylase [Chlorobiota bacterium]